MKKTILFIMAAALVAGAAAGASALDRFSDEQKTKLLAGEAIYEIVQTNEGGETSGYGQSVVIVNTPIEEAFAIFTRFDEQHLYFPRKKESVVVKQWENKALVHKVFDFYVTDIEYTVLYTVDKNRHRVDFQLDPSYPHDIEESVGFFQFEKLDDKKTLFTYAVTKVKTGLKVPGFIQEYISSKDLPGVAENVKKRLESGGKWKKED